MSSEFAAKRRKRLIRRPGIKIDTIRREVKKAVKRNTETHVIYGADNANSTDTTTGALFNFAGPVIEKITDISAGDNAYNRTGNKIHLGYLKANVECYNTSGTPYNAVVRCVLVRDKEPVTGTDITDVKEVYPSMTVANRVSTAMPQVVGGAPGVSADQTRFDILYDQTKVCELKAGENAKDIALFKLRKKINKPCGYFGGSASANDKGQLYMFLMTNQTDNINATYQTRLTFKDA